MGCFGDLIELPEMVNVYVTGNIHNCIAGRTHHTIAGWKIPQLNGGLIIYIYIYILMISMGYLPARHVK